MQPIPSGLLLSHLPSEIYYQNNPGKIYYQNNLKRKRKNEFLLRFSVPISIGLGYLKEMIMAHSVRIRFSVFFFCARRSLAVIAAGVKDRHIAVI